MSLKNTRIEFHILQSFPVSCLNRDDVGSPKSAMIGGTPRARVSSQCWKRAVRMQMHELGQSIAVRTRRIKSIVFEKCIAQGSNETDAVLYAEILAFAFAKGKFEKAAWNTKLKEINKNNGIVEDETDNNEEDASSAKETKDSVLFISDDEINGYIKYALSGQLKINQPNIEEIIQSLGTEQKLDQALFGRMVANVSTLNIEAACSFAHAISVNEVRNDLDYFTAVDDIASMRKCSGTAHLGYLEFNSATYYRYISIDLGKLAENLEDIAKVPESVKIFVQALFLAVPPARQTTMTASPMWDYASILIRNGQRLQLSFDTPVRTSHDSSIASCAQEELKLQIENQKKLCGSLYGEKLKLEFGGSNSLTIDEMTDSIVAKIKELL